MVFELIILLTIIVGFIAVVLVIVALMQQGSKEERQVFLESLVKNTHAVNERLDRAATVMGQVHERIGEVTEIGKSMLKLQELLHSPKARGNIGEQILKELLSQILPQQAFRLQYRFVSGSIVDAIILTRNGSIPIDSKFPLEQFRLLSSPQLEQARKETHKQFIRDVRLHIKAIANKYIHTEEGTVDFALMYLPSESIYYEIVNTPELYDFSSQSRVLPVSPTTFYAFLKTILVSLEGERFGSQAQEVLRLFRAVQKDYEKLDSVLTILIKHVTHAYTAAGAVTQQVMRLGKTLKTSPKQEKKELPDTTASQ